MTKFCCAVCFLVATLVAFVLFSGCATQTAEAPPLHPAAQLLPGLRAGPTTELCVGAPATYEGVFYRLTPACSFVPGGPASCVYLGEVDLGIRWGCVVGIGQASCTAPWEPAALRCDPYSDQFDSLLRQLRGEAEGEK